MHTVARFLVNEGQYLKMQSNIHALASVCLRIADDGHGLDDSSVASARSTAITPAHFHVW